MAFMLDNTSNYDILVDEIVKWANEQGISINATWAHLCYTVGKKTAPMFVHFGKISMVRNNDISKRSEKIT